MNKASFSLVATLSLISAGCFEQANAGPTERTPFGGKTSNPTATLPGAGVYVENGRVMTPKIRLPHDVVSVDKPNSDLEFRIGKPGEEMGEWQPVSSLTAELVRGQMLQLGIKEEQYGQMKMTSFSYESMLDRYLVQKQMRTRKDWGAKEAKNDMTPDAWKQFVAVHHSAGKSNSEDKTVKDIQLFHMDVRKWSDIGYHFLIGPDGTIFEGRNYNYQGAHVKGHNAASVAINFLGCYDEKECHPPEYPEVAEVTDVMVHSMGGLIGALSLHYGIDISAITVKGHKEFQGAATACPGDRVMRRLDEIRALANVEKERLNRMMLGQDKSEL